MATVNVRQLDEEVVQRLKSRAATNNRSLESEVRHILTTVSEDDLFQKRKTFLSMVERLHENADRYSQTPSEVLIREDRLRGHRF